MTSIQSPASAQDKTAMYFVVPVLPDEHGIEEVRYYAPEPGASRWNPVRPADLDARAQGATADQVMLYQPSRADILEHTDLSADKLDTCSTLYGGVARTLETSIDTLPSICAFDGNGFMTVPVNPGSRRGLILIFTKKSGDDKPAQIVKLIATTDPEIKNGVGS